MCVFWLGVLIGTFAYQNLWLLLLKVIFKNWILWEWTSSQVTELFVYLVISKFFGHSHLKIWCFLSILVSTKWYRGRSVVELSILSVVIKEIASTYIFFLFLSFMLLIPNSKIKSHLCRCWESGNYLQNHMSVNNNGQKQARCLVVLL